MTKAQTERVHCRQLRTDEYVPVVIYAIDICGKYDTAAIHLEKSYGELSAFSLDLESLKACVRKNEKVTRPGELDDERDGLIRCINNLADGFDDVDIPETAGGHKVLSALLDSQQPKARVTRSKNKTAGDEPVIEPPKG